MFDIGIDELPPDPEQMVMHYLKKISEIESTMWVPKTTLQKHVKASHQMVEKILNSLTMAGTIQQSRHGTRLVYRLTP